MPDEQPDRAQVPAIRLAMKLRQAFDSRSDAIFGALVAFSCGESVASPNRRRDGTRIWLRPNVAEVLGAQRLLFDRVFGKAPQSIAIAASSAPSAGQRAAAELTDDERSTLADVWHEVLRRRPDPQPVIDVNPTLSPVGK